MLTITQANAKTKKLYKVKAIKSFLPKGKKVYSFSNLSGHSCPMANECYSKVVVDKNNKRTIKDGPNTKFRCYSASQEVLYPKTYDKRKANMDALKSIKTVPKLVAAIEAIIPADCGVLRIHDSGDFMYLRVFDAWLAIAAKRPDILFYCYTKMLPFWVKRRAIVNGLPNFIITASYGGKSDDLISEHSLRYAKVVFAKAEANKLGLEIDNDDSHAANPAKKNDNFALLIHGVQPKNSEAAKALVKLNKRKKSGAKN